MNEDRYGIDDFALYQLARSFRAKAYGLTKELPAKERFVLDPQMRRAALSVSNNIAEGHGRRFYLDAARFCRMARGSVQEVIDDLNTCLDESYFDHETIDNLKIEAFALIKRINSYIGYLKRSQPGKDE